MPFHPILFARKLSCSEARIGHLYQWTLTALLSISRIGNTYLGSRRFVKKARVFLPATRRQKLSISSKTRFVTRAEINGCAPRCLQESASLSSLPPYHSC